MRAVLTVIRNGQRHEHEYRSVSEAMREAYREIEESNDSFPAMLTCNGQLIYDTDALHKMYTHYKERELRRSQHRKRGHAA